MDTAYIILLILLIFYVPFYFYVRSGKLERYGLVKYGPCVMIKTKLGLKTMDRLSSHVRLWRAFGLISKIITLGLMIFMVTVIIIDLMMLPSMFGSSSVGIEYVFAIPGLNPMLPLVYGVIALIVAMVIHELAHGIQSRANDIPVDSSGLLYLVVPIGAFVEPNNEATQKAERRAQMDLYSAGISANFILAAVTFMIMSFGMLGSISAEYGDNPAVVGISAGSPAESWGLPVSSLITGFDDDGDIEMNFDPREEITLYYITEDGAYTVEGARIGVYIAGVVSGSVAAEKDMGGKFISRLSHYELSDGGDDGLIGSLAEFSAFMRTTVPGGTVWIELVDLNGGMEIFEVVLGTNGSVGFLGVQTNVSGMSLSTPNAILDGAMNPFAGSESITDIAYNALSYIGSPIRGYTPIPSEIQWWYGQSDLFWTVATTIYFIFWLNIMLAIFNALPAIPFDGGFLFRGGVDWIADRLKIEGERKERIVDRTTSIVTNVMLLAFMLIVVVMII